MSDLQTLLAKGLRPGVYRWQSDRTADEVRADVVAAGWGFVLLDTSEIHDKTGFLDLCATAFDLPRWFGALNTDFRYQLTPIGGAAPALHIASEIADNRFTIAGGPPGLKVSWMVTGIRHDAWAKANPLSVEEPKPAAERGTFLHPEVLGQPPETQVEYARHARAR